MKICFLFQFWSNSISRRFPTQSFPTAFTESSHSTHTTKLSIASAISWTTQHSRSAPQIPVQASWHTCYIFWTIRHFLSLLHYICQWYCGFSVYRVDMVLLFQEGPWLACCLPNIKDPIYGRWNKLKLVYRQSNKEIYALYNVNVEVLGLNFAMNGQIFQVGITTALNYSNTNGTNCNAVFR